MVGCCLVINRTSNSLRTSRLVTTLGRRSPRTSFHFFNNSLVTTIKKAVIGRCGRLTCVKFVPMLLRLHAVFTGVECYGRSVMS